MPQIHPWAPVGAYLRTRRPTIVLVLACAGVVGFGVALQPLLIRYLIDEGIARPGATPAQRFGWAAFFAGFYLVSSALRMGCWAVGYRRLLKLVEDLLFELRAEFFRHVQGLCLRFHSQVSSGELYSYLMGSPMANIGNFVRQMLILVPTQAVTLALSLGALAWFDLPMTLLLVAVVLTITLINRRSRLRVHELTADFMRTESAVSRYVNDMLRGTRAVKLYAIEDNVSDAFEQEIGRMRIKASFLPFAQWIESAKGEATTYVGLAILYAFGAYSCIYRDLSVGSFVAFATSMQVVTNLVMSLFQLNLGRAAAEASLERIGAILKTDASTPEPEPGRAITVEAAEAGSQALPVVKAPVRKGLASKASTNVGIVARPPFLRFEKVDFGYAPGRPVFRGLKCEVDLGERIALVGGSGSGKSTFINLLLRFYDPDGGRILLHGRDLRDYPLADLRGSFGVVPQDPFLFQASILENIRVSQPKAPLATVMEAMRQAHVDEFVLSLPKGLDTPVGESGFNLSGGQRQRLAIARALLGSPHYLIFDEATSALDNESENLIRESLEAFGREHTVITIAHRLSTIRNVDRILVFDHGRLVEEGSWAGLMKKRGAFHRLVRASQSS
jgi:ABC-type multidrug transport system fused ATPase/permease subunit